MVFKKSSFNNGKPIYLKVFNKKAIIFFLVACLIFLWYTNSDFNRTHIIKLCSPRTNVLIHQSNPNPFPKELSFILLNWKRMSCLKTIITDAQVYSKFITEIVIGNNNPDVLISTEDFESPNIPVRVINFPQNRFFFARYELCLMSTGKYCYMQDDDWDNHHIKTMYANFLKSPHLLHTSTNNFVHYLSWSWTFFDPEINLHTGFSWLGTGAIASKEKVQHFVLSQSFFIDRTDLPLADMYFATWFNQVPYQLQNELHELDTTQTGFSNQQGGINRNKLHITKGIRTLHAQLSSAKPSPLFDKTEHHPTAEERYAKSSCYNDNCLFITSAHNFPSPREQKYDASQDLDAVERVHAAVLSHVSFVNNPYHFAVDKNPESFWLSPPDIKKGDFFGLDLLEPLDVNVFYLTVKHTYQDQLQVEISLDGESWHTDCEWEIDTQQSNAISDTMWYQYNMVSSCKCTFRYIRFRADKNYNESFAVYDISFPAKK